MGRVVAKVVDGIPKRDAAKQLSISERTLDRKLYDLQIECKQIAVPGRRPLVVIPTADFERVKAEMIPVEAAPTSEESTALTVRPSRPTQELVALLRTSLQAPSLPLFRDLKAASLYSGLTQAYVRRQIAEGALKAVKDVGWKVSPHDLDRLAA
jgi:hypothetical protein